jgi:hypothetical protein
MTQRSNVYRRGKFFFVVTAAETKDGLWVSAEPCFKLPVDATPAELGALVTESLDKSRTGVRAPSFKDGAHLRPVLEVSGLKSWSTFAKGASLVLVHRDGDVVSAAPQQNQGSGGFAPLAGGDPLTVTGGGPDEVGGLVGRAFDAAGS